MNFVRQSVGFIAFATAAWLVAAATAARADATSSPSASLPSIASPALKAYFPPDPLIFGAPYSDPATDGSPIPVQADAPPALADYVYENFYAPLSTRLWDDSLGKKLLSRLETHLTARNDLGNELRDKLALLQNTEPAAREQELRAFALVQTPRILALEKSAEQFRIDVVHGSFPSGGVDWNQDREWTLAAAASQPSSRQLSAEFNVLRAAIYYQDGLSEEQRGLLREIALELRDRARASRRRPALSPDDDPAFAIFFSPATARLRLPPKLPSPLVEKIGVFNRERDAMKTELREALRSTDGASNSKRTKALATLAKAQQPRFAALENLADEIRHGLAAVPAPLPPALPPQLPLELARQIEAYRRDASSLRQERFARRIAALTRPARSSLLEKITKPGSPTSDERNTKIRAAAKEADDDFMRKNAGRYADLRERSDAIRRDTEVFARLHLDPLTHRPFDPGALMRALEASNRQFDQLGREETTFSNYRIAMLEPGLSPEQRRLLFGAALVELAQPLPGGEFLPHGGFMPFDLH